MLLATDETRLGLSFPRRLPCDPFQGVMLERNDEFVRTLTEFIRVTPWQRKSSRVPGQISANANKISVLSVSPW